MHAQIEINGDLTVEAVDPSESYALVSWYNELPAYMRSSFENESGRGRLTIPEFKESENIPLHKTQISLLLKAIKAYDIHNTFDSEERQRIIEKLNVMHD
jgi:hypothetical protein